MTKCPITVTILTKNEEALIARCIRALSWADEVIVLDSGSTDATRQLAASEGAVVHEQEWLGWVGQRQRAIALAQHDWIFMVEADEMPAPELASGVMAAMAANPDPADGYVVDRRDELFGKLLPNMKRKALRRDFIRLFNRTRSHYRPQDIIHETVFCSGRRILLPGVLLHWRNVGFMEAMTKDIENAELEAETMARAGKRVGPLRLLAAPVARFGWCYIVKGAWRVGMVGLLYSMMRAHADFLRHARLWERQHTQPALDPPESVWSLADMPRADQPAAP